jgi:uncharacterized small protein (DUF1192 family)
MEPDDFLPKPADDAVAALARQDLDPLSVEELHARVAALETELRRVRLKIETAVNHRATADTLFKR